MALRAFWAITNNVIIELHWIQWRSGLRGSSCPSARDFISHKALKITIRKDLSPVNECVQLLHASSLLRAFICWLESVEALLYYGSFRRLWVRLSGTFMGTWWNIRKTTSKLPLSRLELDLCNIIVRKADCSGYNGVLGWGGPDLQLYKLQ